MSDYCSFFGEHKNSGDTPCPCGYPNRPQDIKDQRLADLEALLAKAKQWRAAQVHTKALTYGNTRDAMMAGLEEQRLEREFFGALDTLIQKDNQR